jgi:Lipoxygenase
VIESPGPGGYRAIPAVPPGTPPRWQIYSAETSTPGAWLYALQAAKTSVTLYGIWFGHVYHWHLTAAAMVRAMKEAIRDRDHPVMRLLYLHSDYLIEFNYFLLAGPAPKVGHDPYLEIAPPTALVTEEQVLWLEDKFAEGRNFFDDDPINELCKNGLVEADFTEKKAWDRFPAAQNLLRIWDICENFVKWFVFNSYRDDAAVAADKGLQKWMENAAKKDQGNIRGLPQLKDRIALSGLLTSQLYRLTAHGVSRLPRSTDPWLTFVANFPPCLQRMEFPAPGVDLSTQELLKYLPNLKTIAGMIEFYYAFAYSKPYTSMIPGGGTDRDLDFPGGAADPRNTALIQYRKSIKQFIEDYTQAQLPPGYHGSSDPKPWLQWPMNIET